MRLCRSSILVFTYFSCLGFYINTPSAATSNSVPQVLEFAQANSKVAATPAVLRPGSQGSDVQRLQIQLKKLGYYSGAVNGKYSVTTEIGVAKFQKVKGLKVDGIFGLETRIRLQATLAAKSQLSRSPVLKSPIINSTAAIPKPTAKPQPTEKERDLIWWLILAVGVFGSFGAFIFLMRWFRQVKRVQNSEISNTKSLNQVKQDPVTAVSSENVTSSQITKLPQTTQLLLPEKTSRLAKLNIVDELIQDLRNPDPIKRHKAIWNLGQQGDSRAIQPMVDLMIDADSQESTLILAALAEIGARTLKPMNRALAMSMQDENPQVRQNAIRDLTRVYDMMSQMSQILCHALEDPDAEVQATARYALSQMNRIRALPEQKNISED